jgi:hypothetical protein
VGAALAGALALRVTRASALALALEPCTGGQTEVALEFEGAWAPLLREQVVADLRAGLRDHSIRLCGSEAAQSPPLASLRLWFDAARGDKVHLRVQDHVTKKTVTREVDLSRLPQDGEGFAVALAADELIYASWAELMLGRRALVLKPPQVVLETVKRSLGPEADSSPQRSISLEVAAERYQEGLTLAGANALYRQILLPSLSWGAWLGARRGFVVEATLGDVESTAVVAGAAVDLIPLGSSFGFGRLEAGVTTATQVGRVSFRGSARDGARASGVAGWTLDGRVGLVGRLSLGSLELGLRGGLGIPFVSFHALEDEQSVASVSGMERWAAVAVGARF